MDNFDGTYKKFMNLYPRVIDDNKNVKDCDISIKSELVAAARSIMPNVDFGNMVNGRINVENMVHLYKSYECFDEDS